MKYNKYEYELILKILNEIENGSKKQTLSKYYNIPRSTIRDWYKNKDKILSYNDIDNNKKIIDIIKNNTESYNYILGMYLGDGYINDMKRTTKLRLFSDKKHINVIEDCKYHLQKIFTNNKVLTFFNNKQGVCEIYVYSNLIKNLFPQGNIKGLKHNRKIELSDIQNKFINYSFLMKGLYHSDGSFYFRYDKKTNYYYPTYSFTNLSKDIINIFCECLKNCNIQYTISIRKDSIIRVFIQKKSEVKKMYNIVGYKIGNNFFNINENELNLQLEMLNN